MNEVVEYQAEPMVLTYAVERGSPEVGANPAAFQQHVVQLLGAYRHLIDHQLRSVRSETDRAIDLTKYILSHTQSTDANRCEVKIVVQVPVDQERAELRSQLANALAGGCGFYAGWLGAT